MITDRRRNCEKVDKLSKVRETAIPQSIPDERPSRVNCE